MIVVGGIYPQKASTGWFPRLVSIQVNVGHELMWTCHEELRIEKVRGVMPLFIKNKNES